MSTTPTNKLKFLATPIAAAVHYAGTNPIFGEDVTHVAIDDEAGGGFIVLTQHPDSGTQKLTFDIEELELVVKVARDMLKTYEKHNKESK
jgi:hypothetical protein